MNTTCERTGIAFDATSKRQKNHPLVSAFLDAANKDGKRYAGAYGAAANILIDIKAAGIETIEDAMDYASQAYTAWKNGEAKPIIRKTVGYYLRERKANAESREAINAKLRAHGYRWHKEDEESMDAFGATAFESRYGANASVAWTLLAPDNREVTVQQALQEIEAK